MENIKIKAKPKSIMLKPLLRAGVFDGANNRPDKALNVDEIVKYKVGGKVMRRRVIAKTMARNITTYDMGVIFALYKMALDVKLDASVVAEEPLNLGTHEIEDVDEILKEVSTVKVAFNVDELAMLTAGVSQENEVTNIKQRCQKVISSLHRLSACMMMVIPVSESGKQDHDVPVYHWLNGLKYSDNLRTATCYLSIELLKEMGAETGKQVSSYNLDVLLSLAGYARLLYGLLCTKVRKGKGNKYYHIDIDRNEVLKTMGLSGRVIDKYKTNAKIAKAFSDINKSTYIPMYKYNKNTDHYEVKLESD